MDIEDRDVLKKITDTVTRRFLDYKYQHPEIHGPYGEDDIEEITQKFLGTPPGRLQTGGRQIERNIYAADHPEEPIFINMISKMGGKVRAELGLNKPVKIAELEQVIENIKYSGPDSIQIWYPYWDGIGHTDYGVGIFLVNMALIRPIYISMNPQNTEAKFCISNNIAMYANLLRCHPDIMLASFLCDYPVYNIGITAVIYPNYQVSVYAKSPVSAPEYINKIYRQARGLAIVLEKINRGIYKENMQRVRQRGKRTEKIEKLVEFYRNTQKLSWGERWERWENEYAPKYGHFKDKNVIRCACHNAISRTGENYILKQSLDKFDRERKRGI